MAKMNGGKTQLRLIGGVPAGNNDGIGANSQAIEYIENGKTTRVLVDFGVKLPSDDVKKKHPEFTGIMPDFRRFFPGENGEPAELPLDAIVLTHAHADHLDGLIYMTLYAQAKKLKMPPIIGSQYTRNTLYRLLRQQNLPKGMFPEFEIMQPCKGKKIGKIEIKTIPVSHTTVGAYGYIFETPTAGYFNQGDNRMLLSHTGIGGNNQMTVGMLRKSKVTHFSVDSTSSGNETTKDITFERTLSEIGRFFDETKGKQAISPVISRSIENLLPILIQGKEHGKKIFIDGYQAKGAFRDWQNDNTVYYMEHGKLQSTSDKKLLKELRDKGTKMYCAEDFREHIWDYDNIMNANADNYAKSVGNKDRLIIVSGAFAEVSETQRSGAIRIAEGSHLTFHDGKDTAWGYFQRIIEGLNDQGVIDLMNMNLRNGGTLYLNYMSEPVLRKKNCKSILNNCKFLEAQLSGHSDEEGTKENADRIASNAKNYKDFDKAKLQALAIHGNEEQRENSKKALTGNERIECYSFCNGDVVEMASGVSKLIEHEDIKDQRFLGIINEPNSGEFVFKSLDGVYDESLRGDEVLPKLSQIAARESYRTERELKRAEALEEEGGKSSMNKYMVQYGKNAGKSKKLPQTKEERSRKIMGKIEKKARRMEENKNRKAARRQKQVDFNSFER
ncbi:MAG: MBL fold metallo-hydrolase [Alphaproteobacteria bacterium]|nr:MBL fold metallo-hydrolase [Alphaproteobacteria bacterium]